jgi:branched-chain amino acid transport system ATP-binding protein
MLEVEQLSLRYGKHLALNEVSVSAKNGTTSVILGANGAGKSSLLKSIVGLVPPEKGCKVSFEGHDLTKVAPHKIVEMGIALVPEGRGIFEQLTVAENLSLGANPSHARQDEKRHLEFVFELFPKLVERRQQIVRTMSGGEQQMVAIGRALMSAPKLLALDEPSLGLAPIMVKELFKALERIKQSGMTILLVEQNVSASLALADQGYLLEAGRIVGAGAAAKLREDEKVKRAFLGAA